MNGFLPELEARGFIQQISNRDALQELLESGPVTAYIGFDPTAESLHAGSLLPIMALVHFQRYGHRPIILLGGGTALVGDPSGRTELRQMLTLEEIGRNTERLRGQLSRFLDFSGGQAQIVDNHEWLSPLKYIDFLRDIGRHFSVNRMLAAEAYRIRMEKGLSFLEFNYQLLQAYDFLVLYRRHGCRVQMGGDDQWGNILAGVDLVRRTESTDVYGLTFPLLTSASQQKMGKTAQGAVWLDPEKCSPYEFYQYWRNADDRDVERFLALFTLLPLEEIRQVARLSEEELNLAKSVLGFEVTKLVHGSAAAEEALTTSARLFPAREIPSALLPSSTIIRDISASEATRPPTTDFPSRRLSDGVPAWEMVFEAGLAASKSEARRLLRQGGIYVNGKQITDMNFIVSEKHLNNGEILLRVGKKKYRRIRVTGT